MSVYWLSLHAKWVQQGDTAVFETAVYPLPYNSFSVRAEASTGQATTQNAAISEHSSDGAGAPSPKEDKTLTLETVDHKKSSTDNQPSPPHSVHKVQPCQQSSSVPDVANMAVLNELFTPSLSFTQEHVKKLKCSSRPRGHKKKHNTSNNSSSESESSADEGSSGHMTSDIPAAFSKNGDESEPCEKTTLDDLFANPLG